MTDNSFLTEWVVMSSMADLSTGALYLVNSYNVCDSNESGNGRTSSNLHDVFFSYSNRPDTSKHALIKDISDRKKGEKDY